MNTPAHLLIGAGLLARPPDRRLLSAALAGSLAPDLSLYVLAGTSIFVLGIAPGTVFDQLYFSDLWQLIFAIDNSAILWGAGLAVAWRWQRWRVFALAGLLHLALDFPLHHDDGRPHFWPLSAWVFESPVSYWDSAHHARWVQPVEAACATLCALSLWQGGFTNEVQILYEYRELHGV